MPYARERCCAGEVFPADIGAIRRRDVVPGRGRRARARETRQVLREVYERDELPYIGAVNGF